MENTSISQILLVQEFEIKNSIKGRLSDQMT